MPELYLIAVVDLLSKSRAYPQVIVNVLLLDSLFEHPLLFQVEQFVSSIFLLVIRQFLHFLIFAFPPHFLHGAVGEFGHHLKHKVANVDNV